MKRDSSTFPTQTDLKPTLRFISGNSRQQKRNFFAEIAELLLKHDGFCI